MGRSCLALPLRRPQAYPPPGRLLSRLRPLLRLAAVGPKRSSRRCRMESSSVVGTHGRETDPSAGSARPEEPLLASSHPTFGLLLVVAPFCWIPGATSPKPCRRIRLPGGGTTPLVPAALARPCGIPSRSVPPPRRPPRPGPPCYSFRSRSISVLRIDRLWHGNPRVTPWHRHLRA